LYFKLPDLQVQVSLLVLDDDIVELSCGFIVDSSSSNDVEFPNDSVNSNEDPDDDKFDVVDADDDNNNELLLVLSDDVAI
jgi:hypothetical protein